MDLYIDRPKNITVCADCLGSCKSNYMHHTITNTTFPYKRTVSLQ